MTRNITINKELNLMVALDLTEMDPILLRYVSFLCTKWKIKKLYLTHNIKQSALYNLYEELFREGITVETVVERELKRTIQENYTGDCIHELVITADNYTEGILTHLAKEYKIDVMITGAKSELQGTGAMSKKLVRMLHCHLMLVPEVTTTRLEKILVPTDFSADSARSIQAARSLVENFHGEIEVLHVYGIPSFFFPYIDFEQAVDKTQTHLKTRFDQFRKKYNLPDYIRYRIRDKEGSSVVETLENEAETKGFDMVVISARGSNNLTSLFIGSITNDLLLRIRKMPLLVIK